MEATESDETWYYYTNVRGDRTQDLDVTAIGPVSDESSPQNL